MQASVHWQVGAATQPGSLHAQTSERERGRECSSHTSMFKHTHTQVTHAHTYTVNARRARARASASGPPACLRAVQNAGSHHCPWALQSFKQAQQLHNPSTCMHVPAASLPTIPTPHPADHLAPPGSTQMHACTHHRARRHTAATCARHTPGPHSQHCPVALPLLPVLPCSEGSPACLLWVPAPMVLMVRHHRKWNKPPSWSRLPGWLVGWVAGSGGKAACT